MRIQKLSFCAVDLFFLLQHNFDTRFYKLAIVRLEWNFVCTLLTEFSRGVIREFWSEFGLFLNPYGLSCFFVMYAYADHFARFLIKLSWWNFACSFLKILPTDFIVKFHNFLLQNSLVLNHYRPDHFCRIDVNIPRHANHFECFPITVWRVSYGS